MKSNSFRNKIEDFLGNYKDKTNKDFNQTGFYTLRERKNNDLDDFEKKISLNKNSDFKSPVITNSDTSTEEISSVIFFTFKETCFQNFDSVVAL